MILNTSLQRKPFEFSRGFFLFSFLVLVLMVEAEELCSLFRPEEAS